MRSLRPLAEELSRENESLQDESGNLRRELLQTQQSRDIDRMNIERLTEHKRLLVSALNKLHQERVSKFISRSIYVTPLN